jgi:hypothetical protein
MMEQQRELIIVKNKNKKLIAILKQARLSVPENADNDKDSKFEAHYDSSSEDDDN